MSTQQLGSLETVDAHKVWPDEARDFTPWLAANLGLLGKALGLNLKLVGQEVQVGRFSLDIQAQDVGRGLAIAVENQLTWSDHTHLGQLLTYAAGIDARVLVWVGPELLDEHRAALDWLNRWTREEIEAYGVEVRVVRIGESLPAPEFRPVVVPKIWSDRSSRGLLPESQAYRDFFQPLVDELRRTGFTDRTKALASKYQSLRSDFQDIHYYASLEGGRRAWAYLFIDGSDKKLNKRIFDALHEHKTVIERDLNAELAWNRSDNQRFSSVGLSTDGALDDPADKHNEIRDWILSYLPKLRCAINPRLEQVMRDLQPGEALANAQEPPLDVDVAT